MSDYHNRSRAYASIIAVLVVGICFGGYQYFDINRTLKYTTTQLAISRQENDALLKQNAELGGTLSETVSKRDELDSELRRQLEENEELQEERDELEKLAKTDKQLLAKYSKVSFLNENYAPIKLDDIDAKYTLPAGKTLEFLDPALPYLEDLLEEAEEDGVALRIVSAYRSFETQASLKSGYRVNYGSGANAFSADQGYSEHQLGTTVDFTTPNLAAAVPAFENTAASAWLVANAHKYGFILSYPKANAYYIYEPWHWRFVGEDLARDLHRSKKNFYDMDQREIDEYLIKIFD